ncbi:endo alpha-1,4 polygalactosaminidase [Spirilliplanes yamanashiensis]|uniref:Endo alpha-1,4 polygalactosaminidase n=1 Tax=Spirilliplanes yamanashiensis TaxID=42233 RepID=A0A8J3Y5U0_9ACTN|nr:endo alpha-1,4 polygalactosaminidase [Spirilliplanes yamanashiensis]
MTLALGGCQPPPAPPPPPAGRWAPAPGTTWQWQLTGAVDVTVDAAVFDVDGFTTPAATVRELHARGRKVICYISVGSAEDFRPDAHRWPPAVLGRPLPGWPGERWLDIRDPERLAPVLRPRLDMCRDKGFDGVEPDIMDAYRHDTGFPLTAAHQLAFNRWIAREAHARGLAAGLKNDLDQVPALVADFDFAVNEECAAYAECAALTPFVAAGKAVFHAEYDLDPAAYCPATTRLGLSSIRKDRDLGPRLRRC